MHDLIPFAVKCPGLLRTQTRVTGKVGKQIFYDSLGDNTQLFPPDVKFNYKLYLLSLSLCFEAEENLRTQKF